MKIHILSVALLVAALSVPVQQAAATTLIDTTGGRGGTTGSFGFPSPQYPHFATFGQTFTVSGPDTQLDSFSLYLDGRYGDESGTLDLRGYIASWDNVNFRASTILFESATQTMNAVGTLQEFAFSPGGLGLTTGQQYVAFLSISNLAPQPSNAFGLPANDFGLSGEGFVFLNNALGYSLLTSSRWTGFSGDLWFKASLSAPTAVPEPSSLLLLVAGLVGLVAWRRKRAA